MKLKKYSHRLRRILLLLTLVVFGLATGLNSTAEALTQFTTDDLNHSVKNRPAYNGEECVATVAATSSLDRFLQVIADKESGGDPTAENDKSTASGKYQYVDGTWESVTETYYPPGQQYARAKDAPEEVQDAVAYLEYAQKARTLGSDPFKLAVSHFYPEANEDPSKLDEVILPNSITPRQYADDIVKRLKDGAGLDIQLLYAQAPDFQTHLAALGGTAATVGTASVSTGSSGCEPEAAGVPAGQFVFYSQYDPRWEDHAFGSSTIGPSGCGPTAVAMVVATLKDRSVTPVETADFGTQNDAYVPGQGSDHQKMLVEGPEHWGLQVEDLQKNMDRALQVLRAGGLVIASGSGPVPFTEGGHIIVLRGISASGKLLVGDSAHEESNRAEYDSTELLKSISAMYGVTK